MRNLVRLLDDEDIRVALVRKVIDEGAWTYTPEPTTCSACRQDPSNPWTCCLVRVSLEWRGLKASVMDGDGVFDLDDEDGYLDRYFDDGTRRADVPRSYAAQAVLDQLAAKEPSDALDWKPAPDGSLSAWMGFWELCVRPGGPAGGWDFHVVNPIGDHLSGRRLDKNTAIAECHELARRLAGEGV